MSHLEGGGPIVKLDRCLWSSRKFDIMMDSEFRGYYYVVRDLSLTLLSVYLSIYSVFSLFLFSSVSPSIS